MGLPYDANGLEDVTAFVVFGFGSSYHIRFVFRFELIGKKRALTDNSTA